MKLWESYYTQKRLEEATILMEEDIDISVSTFTDILKSAAKCMQKKCYTQKKMKKNPWFDGECAQAKKETRQKLKRFRETKNEENRCEFLNAKNKYKYLIKHKMKTFRREKVTRLENSIKDSTIFWNELKSMGCGKSVT